MKLYLLALLVILSCAPQSEEVHTTDAGDTTLFQQTRSPIPYLDRRDVWTHSWTQRQTTDSWKICIAINEGPSDLDLWIDINGQPKLLLSLEVKSLCLKNEKSFEPTVTLENDRVYTLTSTLVARPTLWLTW